MGEELDGRADQYALAATAFHLLTGSPPFPHSNPAVVIGRHLSTPPPKLGDTNADLAGLDSVISRALAKDPAARFDSCRDFVQALAQGGTATPAEPTARLSPPPIIAASADSTSKPASAPITPAVDQPTTQHAAPPVVVSSWATEVPADKPAAAPTDDAQLPTNTPAPFREGTNREQTAGSGSDAASTSRRTALIAGGIAALLAVGVVAFIGARLAQPRSAPPTASPPQPSSTLPASPPPEPPQTVTYTPPPVTVIRPSAPPTAVPHLLHRAYLHGCPAIWDYRRR